MGGGLDECAIERKVGNRGKKKVRSRTECVSCMELKADARGERFRVP